MTDRSNQNPAQKAKSKKKLHIDAGSWISLASAITAIIAAIIAGLQVNLASQQNVAADQQQLLTLTSTIGQQLAQGAAAENQPGAVQSATPTQAESNAQIVLTTELTAEGEAAAVLIDKLHGNGVAGIEYVEAGDALAEGDNIAQALVYYRDAVNAPPRAAGTRSDALRSAATIYYALGRSVAGHRDMMLAVKIYNNHRLELSQSGIANSIAESYLDDANLQLGISGCKIAVADMAAGLKALSSRKVSANATNKRSLALALVAYGKHCPTAKH